MPKERSLVKVHAPWCGPCKSFAPIIEKVTNDLDHIQVIDVDIDINEQAIDRYNIKGVPTIILMNGDVELNRVSGQLSEQELIDFINTDE